MPGKEKKEEVPVANLKPNAPPFTATINDAAETTVIDETPPSSAAGRATLKGKTDADQA